MAKLMQLLQRYSEVPFELVFLVMDPGYNEINRNKIEQRRVAPHPDHRVRDRCFRGCQQQREEPLLPVCADAPRLSVQQGAGAWLQQDRARPPFQRCHRNHRHEYVCGKQMQAIF